MKTLALAAAALVLTSSVGAVAQPNCYTRRALPPSLADAAFNHRKVLNGEVFRQVEGNSFAVFARADEICANFKPGQIPRACSGVSAPKEWRLWKAVMVTAAHVVDDMCRGAPDEGAWQARAEIGRRWTPGLLTLAPNTLIEENSAPVEIPINIEWCKANVDALEEMRKLERPGAPLRLRGMVVKGPDIWVFPLEVALPRSSSMVPYAISPGSEQPENARRADEQYPPADLKVRGFVPILADRSSTEFETSPAFGPVVKEATGLNTFVGDVKRGDPARTGEGGIGYFMLKKESIAPGQSGAPVVGASGLVEEVAYGVLVRRAPRQGRPECQSDDPAAAPAENVAEENNCPNSEALDADDVSARLRSYMSPLWTAQHLFSREAVRAVIDSNQNQRIDAAVSLYTSLAESKSGSDSSRDNRIQTFKIALSRLTALEQIAMWSRITLAVGAEGHSPSLDGVEACISPILFGSRVVERGR